MASLTWEAKPRYFSPSYDSSSAICLVECFEKSNSLSFLSAFSRFFCRLLFLPPAPSSCPCPSPCWSSLAGSFKDFKAASTWSDRYADANYFNTRRQGDVWTDTSEKHYGRLCS